MSLNHYTTEQLEVEIARRKGSLPGAEYYYLDDPNDWNDEESGVRTFGLVECKFWDSHHILDEGHVPEDWQIPPGFEASAECVWEYKGCSHPYVMLEKYGYKPVPDMEVCND